MFALIYLAMLIWVSDLSPCICEISKMILCLVRTDSLVEGINEWHFANNLSMVEKRERREEGRKSPLMFLLLWALNL